MDTGAGNLERSRYVDRTIRIDRACVGCGYNLRGLTVGGECPECGRGIERRTFSDEPLSNMPREVLGRFRVGGWLGALAACGLIASNIMLFFGHISSLHQAFVLLAIAAVWLAAVVVLTPAIPVYEAVVRGFSARGVTRQIARGGQIGWLIFFGCGVTVGTGGNLSQGVVRLLDSLAWFGVLIGVIGLIAMAVMMERLAEWTRDETARSAFHWFQWILPLAIIGMLGRPIAGSIMGPMTVTAFDIISVIGFTALLVFPLGILLLARSIAYADIHRHEREARDLRRELKRSLESAEVDERIRAMSETQGLTQNTGGGQRDTP